MKRYNHYLQLLVKILKVEGLIFRNLVRAFVIIPK